MMVSNYRYTMLRATQHTQVPSSHIRKARGSLSVTLPIHQKKEKIALHDLYVRLW